VRRRLGTITQLVPQHVTGPIGSRIVSATHYKIKFTRSAGSGVFRLSIAEYGVDWVLVTKTKIADTLNAGKKRRNH
jgi:hypothetical protein